MCVFIYIYIYILPRNVFSVSVYCNLAHFDVTHRNPKVSPGPDWPRRSSPRNQSRNSWMFRMWLPRAPWMSLGRRWCPVLSWKHVGNSRLQCTVYTIYTIYTMYTMYTVHTMKYIHYIDYVHHVHYVWYLYTVYTIYTMYMYILYVYTVYVVYVLCTYSILSAIFNV